VAQRPTATEHESGNPKEAHNQLLDLYREHPLHARTEHVHGFTMLTTATQAALDARCSAAVDARNANIESVADGLAGAA